MKLKMHVEYFGGTNMRFTPPDGKTVYKTLCWLNVDGSQIAASEEGVTCKRCITNLAQHREWEATRGRVLDKSGVDMGPKFKT